MMKIIITPTVFVEGVWNSELVIYLCPAHSSKQILRWCCRVLDLYDEDKDGLHHRLWVSVMSDQDVYVSLDVWMSSHWESKSCTNNETTDLWICLPHSVRLFFWLPAWFSVQWWKCPQTILCQKSRRGCTSETSSWA